MKSKFLTGLVDYTNTFLQFIVLNLLFLISCIPVVTIGPALAALYQVTMREARNENGYLARYYLKCFKEMFRQALVTFIFLGTLFLAFLFSAAFWMSASLSVALPALVLSYIGFLLVFITLIYVFPLMARFSNTTWQTIKNAFLLALSNAKFTFILLILHLFELSLCYLFPMVRVFMIVVGFAFFAYCNSFLFVKFFGELEER